MEQAGRQRALLAVVGALSLGGPGCTERVPLISSVSEVDAAEEPPEDAYVRPDRPIQADLAPDEGSPDLGPDVKCMDFPLQHRLDLEYPEVVVALDRSFSMYNHKQGAKSWWTAAREELLSFIEETDGTIAFGYAEFPGRVTCDPSVGCCTRMPLNPTLNSHAGISDAWQCTTQSCFETTDESPSGHVLSRIHSHFDAEQAPIPEDRYVLLVTDGAPTCAADPDECEMAKAQASRMFSMGGIKTIVLPLGEEARASQCLDDVAEMGQTRTPGSTTFPWAADATQVRAKLRELMAPVQERTCRFLVKGEIKNRDSLSVSVTFKALPRDPTHKEGWDYDASGSPEIWVYGTTCKKLQCLQLDQQDVRAEESCTQCGSAVVCR
jgi:hypothetical protein